jgi:hypothetical protein
MYLLNIKKYGKDILCLFVDSDKDLEVEYKLDVYKFSFGNLSRI